MALSNCAQYGHWRSKNTCSTVPFAAVFPMPSALIGMPAVSSATEGFWTAVSWGLTRDLLSASAAPKATELDAVAFARFWTRTYATAPTMTSTARTAPPMARNLFRWAAACCWRRSSAARARASA